MVNKSSETEPVRNPITITVRATVPLMEYGNITLEATQDIIVPDTHSEAQRAAEIVEGLSRMKSDLALVILPMVEAEVTRLAPWLIKESDPDNSMRKNCSVYRWLRIAQPGQKIPAMDAILASKPVPNSGLE